MISDAALCLAIAAIAYQTMPADMAAAYTDKANAARTRLDLENIIITMQQEIGE